MLVQVSVRFKFKLGRFELLGVNCMYFCFIVGSIHGAESSRVQQHTEEGAEGW